MLFLWRQPNRIRPGRKFKREHKVNKREFHMNYKPFR